MVGDKTMIYILAWLVCGVCSFYLLKSFLYRITKDQGGFIHCVQELFKKLDELEIKNKGFSDDSRKLVSDNTLLAIVHTLFLILNLIIWPVVLVALLYWMYTSATWDDLVYEKENVNE
jgi:hypothetical protein